MSRLSRLQQCWLLISYKFVQYPHPGLPGVAAVVASLPAGNVNCTHDGGQWRLWIKATWTSSMNSIKWLTWQHRRRNVEEIDKCGRRLQGTINAAVGGGKHFHVPSDSILSIEEARSRGRHTNAFLSLLTGAMFPSVIGIIFLFEAISLSDGRHHY